MINLVFEGMTNNVGGKETYIMNIFNKLSKEKYKCYFIAYDQKIAYEEYIHEHGGIIIHITPRNGNFIRFYNELNNFFNVNNIDVVWTHKTTLSSCELISIAKKNKVPVRIIHSHCSENMGGKFTQIMHDFNKKRIRNMANVYFACSDVASKWFYDEQSSTILKNAIDLEKFKFNENVRIKLRHSLGVENKFVIGHIGRFGKEKNHKKLLTIFKEYSNRNPNSVLILCGDGEERGNIEQLISDLSLECLVKIMGTVRNVHEYLQVFDVIVMPSLFEGLPFSLLEAQAAGLKCVVSDTISDEANVVGWNKSVKLNALDKEWVDVINNINYSYQRENGYVFLKKNGFDIVDNIEYIEEVILRAINEHKQQLEQ